MLGGARPAGDDAAAAAAAQVLVQCEWGINRSATVTAAYLMRHERLSLRQALQLLRTRRPCTRPLNAYVAQLAALERQWLPALPDADRLQLDELPTLYDERW